MVNLVATDDLFARLDPTERYDKARLAAQLRQAHAPDHLADDPIAYADEWWRIDDLEAWRSPCLPRFAEGDLDRSG